MGFRINFEGECSLQGRRFQLDFVWMLQGFKLASLQHFKAKIVIAKPKIVRDMLYEHFNEHYIMSYNHCFAGLILVVFR